MTTTINETTQRQAARVAGLGYLAIFFLAIFANFVVIEGLVDQADAALTLANISESAALARFGIAAFLVVFVLDVAVAWALYIVFKQVNRDVSLLTAWFRLVYTVLLGVALVFFFLALQLVNGSEHPASFSADQLGAQSLLLFDAFNFTWLVGLVAFGIHLAMLGYLILTSGLAPRVIGVLLAAAGAAYMIDTFAHTLMASYADYANLFLAMVAAPSIIGEMALAVWLLARAGKNREPSPSASTR